jgi:polyribonucleotide nucleotidyltransferase
MEKNIIRKEVYIDGIAEPIIFETGWKAKKANGSVWVNQGGTVVLVTAVMSRNVPEYVDFFPLTVNYVEKFYAVGKIPGGFIKREGKPSEKETLVSRLIDRPLRPLFPDGFRNETQIVATVLSSDPEFPSDVLAINGASLALMISDIPFNGPVGAVRVAKIDNKLVLNPRQVDLDNSTMNIVVAGTNEAIVMVEAGLSNVKEEEVLEALAYAHKAIKGLTEQQISYANQFGKGKYEYVNLKVKDDLVKEVEARIGDKIKDALAIADRNERYKAIENVKESFLEEIEKTKEEIDNKAIYSEAFAVVEKQIFRRFIVDNNKRVDERNFDEIRPIDIEVGILPKTHGSALFTRGETQSLATVTLGTKMDVQLIDDMDGMSSKRFILHYNFPPFSVGEVGFLRGPGRREIGHGALAERSLEYILPDENEFPYTIRVVSEILESNGSSSMATVCGGCLSLMDAGVPVKDIVAGIAMGLIYESNKYIVLTDIMGIEDHLGDMDFKVAGTETGITALQMDIKIEGLSENILKEALEKAKVARLFVLKKMKEVLAQPRNTLSPNAPRYETIKINPEKIGLLIGPGGKMIKSIIEETKATIDILEDGLVNIFAKDKETIERAKELINAAIQELVEDNVYKAKVKKIVDYGMFVEILPIGVEGLVHISQIDKDRVEKVSDLFKEGDIIEVKYMGKDAQGRIKLSRKILL